MAGPTQTAQTLLQGMTSHGVVRSVEVTADLSVAGPTQLMAGPTQTAQTLLQGMTSHGVVRSAEVTADLSVAGPVRRTAANPVLRTKFVRAGDWVTLETYFHTNATLTFQSPAGAQIKIRYGGGWIFGFDSQKQTLDGAHAKTLSVSSTASTLLARVQIKVPRDTFVTYSEARTGP
jgi:hypothetical protein